MKLFHDYKKLFLKIVLTVLVITSPALFSYAQTVSDIQNQINQKNSDISSLEQEIASYQSQLDTLGQQKNSLSTSIKQLDITKKSLDANISVTQKKIDKTNLTIQSLSSDIADKQTSISNSLNSIALEINQANELDSNNELETLLSGNDFTSAWNDLDNAITVRDKIKSEITTLQKTKGALEDTRSQSIDAKNQLIALKSQLSDQEKIVVQNTNEKNQLLKQTKNNEVNYQVLLADRMNKKNEFEKELQNYESQLKYILDPASLPSGGVLSWPLDYILVTNPFGKNTSRIYASGWHNGVDFRAAVGTPVKAMADGVVMGTGDTDLQCRGASFGRFILIKYNNGLSSTYGHLSLIKVSQGQNVTRGEIVGYSGNTGYSVAPHLHVSVYASAAVSIQSLPSKACPGRILTQPISPTNAYLDPLFYLPRTTAAMFKANITNSD
jgi:murein DD-endopeptidase MepM/ murein hydrolase activator NlpD